MAVYFPFVRERCEGDDYPSLDACMAQTVMENFRRHTHAGIDIVSDAECSRIIYATNVNDP